LNPTLHPDDFRGKAFFTGGLRIDLEIDIVCVEEVGERLAYSLTDQGTALREVHADQCHEEGEENGNTARYEAKFRYPHDHFSAPLFAGALSIVSILFVIVHRH
jgi:hypothetical protein